MNVRKYIYALIVVMAFLYACNNDDDDDGVERVPPRDFAEQQANEDPLIQEYLKKHFFNLVDNDANPDYPIVEIDTIAGVNSEQTSIWDSGLLTTKVITRFEVDYTLYILNLTKNQDGVMDGISVGAGERKPTFADSTFVTYRGEQFYENQDDDGDGIPNAADVDADGDGAADVDTVEGEEVTREDEDEDGIADFADVDTNPDEPDSDGDGVIDDKDTIDNNDPDRRVFDSAVNPIWFDQVNVIEGWREALVGFKGASNFSMPDVNGDGTINYNTDFGNLVVFIPSGLAYFNAPPSGTGIGFYKSLIFNIQLYGVNEADHDNDGIPSYLEDLDNDRLVVDDNTDSDVRPNYLDIDDDGDGTRTVNEDLEPDTDLTVDRDGDGDPTNDIGDGDPANDDTDGDGIPNYLDPDDKGSRNDTN
ncbi:FKBP-type peptidyl-prolyl cis-trans isomerase [Aquimarina sp. RZ0]|uniref:FKBP-type peptidyl-prolyl cis-trans isomerase n=1 Tax=Aquimarina sp. RZ0 TaxID=2607730 RepID=UPI0011F3CB97|nr:hypothetical protein [Aquimarina sp. RZ0]KAA1246492.1 hypothetical protein F0000_07755 [Aquimarina sp. RZ0]